MAPRRPRFGGSVNDIVEAIIDFATSPTFLPYPDMPSDKKKGPHPKVHQTLIKKQRGMLIKLKFSKGNLSFTPQQVSTALAEIARRKEWRWRDGEEEDWIKTTGGRLRLMLRHVSQALTKQNQWALDLFDPAFETTTSTKEEL